MQNSIFRYAYAAKIIIRLAFYVIDSYFVNEKRALAGK